MLMAQIGNESDIFVFLQYQLEIGGPRLNVERIVDRSTARRQERPACEMVYFACCL